MPRSRASASYTITARDRTRAGVASAKQSIGSLDTVVSKLGINFSIMSAAAAAAPLGIVAANAPVIDSYGKLSEKLGISVEAVQGFIDAAERAGVAQNSLFTSLQRGVRRVSEAANGIGEARGALDELGISAEALQELKPEDRILAILDAIKELGDEGDRVRIAAKIFDSEGVDLVRLTGDAVRDATQRMVEMQRALTEIDVANVETMNDEMQLLQAYTRSATQIFTAEMAPAVTGLIRLITGSAESMDGFRQTSQIAGDVFIDVIGAIGNGVEGLDNIFESVKIGLQGLNVVAAQVAAFTGNDEAVERLENARTVLQQLKDDLAGQTGDATFWEQLEASAARAREQSAAAAEALEEVRARFATNTDVSLGEGESNLTGGVNGAAAQQAATAFESIVGQLESDSEKIETVYQNRLAAIETFKTAYPDRIEEAEEAAVRALSQRNNAYTELLQRQEDQAGRGSDQEATAIASSFDAVVKQLETDSERIETTYNARIAAIDAFRVAYPERIAEADAAAARALEENNQAFVDLIEKQEEQDQSERTATLRPLEFNFEAIREQFATEADILIEETEKRVALLEELGQLDAERKAEADSLIISLEEDKQRKLTQIQKAEELTRLSSQTNFASQSLNVLSSLVENTGALGDRSTKAAARISQIEALVAGVSAAERARNHASLYGGVGAGAVAAVLSWAGTLANVAGIEAALQGGTPGGPSGSGGGASASAADTTIRNLESGDDNEAQPLQVTFNLDPSLIDAQAFEDMTVKSVSNASGSRRLVLDVNGRTITNNTEEGS